MNMTKEQQMISVIMPTYNRQDFICEAIDSALNQTWKNLELIVVDDGSTDNTKELLNNYSYDRRFKYRYQENQGQCVARNRGLKEAKGHFIAFLDSDNIWFKDKLEKQMRIVACNTEYDVFLGDGIRIDEKGAEIPGNNMKRYSGCVTKYLIRDNFVSMNTTLVNKSCFDDLGGMDESVRVGDDYELWLRLSTKYKFHYTPDNYIKYRVMPNQISSDKERRLKSNEIVLNKFFDRFPCSVSTADKRRGLSFFYVRKARYEISKYYYKRACNSIWKGIKYDCLWMGPWRSIFLMFLTSLNLH